MFQRNRILLLTLVVIILSVLIVPHTVVKAATYTVGAGSYTDTLPSGRVQPPSTIYKTANLTGGIPTSNWESSILFQQYSQPLIAHPLSFRCVAGGLELGRPNLGGGGVAYFGTHANDFTVKHTGIATVADSRADKISDWAVDVVMASGANNIKATLVKGSPYAYFIYTGGNPQLAFGSTPTVFYGSAASSYLGVTVNGKSFGLFAPTGSTWSGIGTTTITCNLASGKNYFSVATLPDNTTGTLTYFKDRSYAFVTNTTANWSYNESASTLTTTFTFTTTAKEGANTETIMALYPHQWRNNTLIAPLSYTYNTLRGIMKTVAGTSFQVRYAYRGILPNLPDKGSYNRTTLYNLINEVAGMTIGSGDTYWVGKNIGKTAVALPIAEQVGHTTAANNYLNQLKSCLQDWFTASPGETGNLFYYNQDWGTLIGYPASYGSDTSINDHHFHYGYYIHGAAQVAFRDKAWGSDSQWGGMVKQVIKNFANWERTDTKFPFLRTFDAYEGHSWASGDSNFADGNNQESSSEATNAYMAMILFGEATGNTALRDAGIYLYTTEVESILNYWFDIYGDIFNSAYSHNYAAMVWGTKYCHQIWWAGTPAEIHGINYLPMTAATLYVGRDKDYVRDNYNEMIAECGGGTPSSWVDLSYMYYALSDPAAAKNLWNTSISPEAGQTKAHAYHWIYNLDGMGLPDWNVTANTPLYGVFNKNGTRTYVVYNASNSAKTVTFSDGKAMTVPANAMATSTGSGPVVTPSPPPATPTPTRAATPTPSGKVLPGQIEAENYDAMSGIDTEATGDTGGGLNVGWIDANDWMDYNVNVQTGGTYRIDYRVASTSATGRVDFRIGATTLASTAIPNTGGWQVWTTVSANVSLNAGNHTIRLFAGGGGWNINWFSATAVGATPTPTRAATATPTPTRAATATPTPTPGSTLPSATWYLFNQNVSGVTPAGENLQTTQSGISGWQPIKAITGTASYWYSPTINGTYKAGNWSFVLWTNNPGSAVNVTVELYRVNSNGSGATLLGSQTLNAGTSAGGNHATTYTFSNLGAVSLSNQRLMVKVVKSSGVDLTVVYNTNDFPTRLITP